jgi:hypothetical protein
MWSAWSLRAKIVGLTIAVTLPLPTASTALIVRLSCSALEGDARQSRLALAREFAASAASRQRAGDPGPLQQR